MLENNDSHDLALPILRIFIGVRYDFCLSGNKTIWGKLNLPHRHLLIMYNERRNMLSDGIANCASTRAGMLWINRNFLTIRRNMTSLKGKLLCDPLLY